MQELNLTKIFVRFLKENKIYFKFMTQFTKHQLFYDGVIDNIYSNIEKKKVIKSINFSNILYDENIEMSLRHALDKDFGDYHYLTVKLSNFLFENKLNKRQYLTTKKTYLNYATPIIVDFLNQNNALEEVTHVLFVQGKLKECEIKDNDIDKLLRKHNVNLRYFFSNDNTFCDWDEYDDYSPPHVEWYLLHIMFEDYIQKNNIKNLIP